MRSGFFLLDITWFPAPWYSTAPPPGAGIIYPLSDFSEILQHPHQVQGALLGNMTLTKHPLRLPPPQVVAMSHRYCCCRCWSTYISKSKIQSISTQCTSTYMWAAVAAGLIHVVYIFLAWITCLRFDAITLLHFAAAVLARPACCCPTSGQITLSHRNNVFSYKHQIQILLRKCHIYGGGAAAGPGAAAAAAKSFIVVSKWVIVSYGLS